MAYKASKEKPLGPNDIFPINSNPPSAMSYKNGRYRKIKDLGEGSFGAVFSACDTQDRSVKIHFFFSTITLV